MGRRNDNTTLRVIEILSPGVEIGIAGQLAANANPEGGARGHLARRSFLQIGAPAVVDGQPQTVPRIAVIDKAHHCRPSIAHEAPRHADGNRGAAVAQDKAAAGGNRHFRPAFSAVPAGNVRRLPSSQISAVRRSTKWLWTMKDFRRGQVPAAIDHQAQGIARSLRPGPEGLHVQGLGVPGGTGFVFLLTIGILAAVGNEVAAWEFAAAGQIDHQRRSCEP